MSELATRTSVGIILIAIALASALFGGTVFAVLVALIATVMYVEWTRLVGRWGFGWKFFGFFYCLLPAVSLLWIRERAEYEGVGTGFDLLIWVFLVVWATDIGAYFAGRAIGGASSGGICAFTAAWERPDLFSKVLSHVGSFTNIRHGDQYPGMIRKTEPKPIRVRNIFICSRVVFCASSRITKASFSVRPRMNASGATSITLRSISVATRSKPIIS